MHHSIAQKAGSSLTRIILRFSSTLPQPSPKLQVYGFKLSQPTRSILLLLNSVKIDYDLVEVNALKGENRSNKYLLLNPYGLVPCIQEPNNGMVLAESGACLIHLSETREELTKLWVSEDIKVRATK